MTFSSRSSQRERPQVGPPLIWPTFFHACGPVACWYPMMGGGSHARVKRKRSGFEVTLIHSGMSYDPAVFDCLLDAIGHAELWCTLLYYPDPDTRPMMIETPVFFEVAR